MNQNKILLGYWKSRGRAEVARQLLSICQVQWQQKQYSDPAEWFGKDKISLDLPLPNLPYLIDGDFKLTESAAIYRHILRKYGKREFLGRSIRDEAIVDSLCSLCYDIDHANVVLFWDPEWKNKLEHAKAMTVPKFQSIAKMYGNNTFVLGYPSLPDFLFAQLSYYVQKLIPEEYKQLAFLDRLRKGVNEIPQIKEYYKKKGSLPFVEEGQLAF